MGIEYTNRRGDVYFLCEGKTKTGKPKYYASRKAKDKPVTQMPEGFEFFENPEAGLVSVRKIRPSQITGEEREFLENQIRTLAETDYFIVDIQEDSLVVYTPGDDPEEVLAGFEEFFGPFRALREEKKKRIALRARYMPMFRFTLRDKDKRLFSVERWCYKGSIDNWFYLAGARSLSEQAAKYLPHLTKESFFNLM